MIETMNRAVFLVVFFALFSYCPVSFAQFAPRSFPVPPRRPSPLLRKMIVLERLSVEDLQEEEQKILTQFSQSTKRTDALLEQTLGKYDMRVELGNDRHAAGIQKVLDQIISLRKEMADAENQRRLLKDEQEWELLRQKMLRIEKEQNDQKRLLLNYYSRGNLDLRGLIGQIYQEDQLELLNWFVGYRIHYLAWRETLMDPEVKNDRLKELAQDQVSTAAEMLDFYKREGRREIESRYRNFLNP